MRKSLSTSKLERIECDTDRKISYCKRKRGLLKKAIEISVLCDLNICILIQDPDRNNIVQFCSSRDYPVQNFFETPSSREFYSISDYQKFGGVNFDEQGNLDVGEE
jgi:hypothetical protein